MQNIDGIAAHSVENSKWIANDRSYADGRALRDARSGPGYTANAVNDTFQPAPD